MKFYKVLGIVAELALAHMESLLYGSAQRIADVTSTVLDACR